MQHAIVAPADIILGRLVATLSDWHPDFIRRLQDNRPAVLLVTPTDLPFRFLVMTGPAGLSLRLVLPGETVQAATQVSAPLDTLTALAECRMDADAIFFDRTLTIDGDIEPVLTIRNAIESESIQIARTVAAAFGPLAAPAQRIGAVASDALSVAATALRAVRSSLLAPVLDRLDGLERAVNRIENAAASPRTKRGS